MTDYSNPKQTTVNCPHCEKKVVWAKESPFRPFCSERCKLIDFGDWAEESHKISSDLVENPEDFIEQ
jgi:endogenous inhibitor of DNA gyrase (YacG/DUF329 family)